MRKNVFPIILLMLAVAGCAGPASKQTDISGDYAMPKTTTKYGSFSKTLVITASNKGEQIYDIVILDTIIKKGNQQTQKRTLKGEFNPEDGTLQTEPNIGAIRYDEASGDISYNDEVFKRKKK